MLMTTPPLSIDLQGNRQQRILTVVATYVLLWLLLWFAARIADVLGGASLWFLPAGLRFCAFILIGWPALLIELATVLIANLISFVSSGRTAPELLSAQAGWLFYDWCALPLAYAAVIFPFRRTLRNRLDLTLPKHSALFIGAALASAIVGAMVGGFYLVGSGIIPQGQWAQASVSWFTGDFIGIITLAPLLLVRGWPWLVNYMQEGQQDNSLASIPGDANPYADRNTICAAFLALLIVFGVPAYLSFDLQFPLLALLLLVPLVWVALSYGLRSAVLAVILLDSGMVLAVALLNQQQMALEFQMVMIAIALVGLWLGGAVASRNQVLQNFNKQLLTEVAQQTLAFQEVNRDLGVKEQHLQLVLTAAPVGVLQLDGAGRCTYLNGIGRLLTDCTSEQALGKHLFDFVHPQDRDMLETAWVTHRQSGKVQTLEVRLANSLWCSAHWIHLPHSDSSTEGAILVLTDSTEHRQREDRLWMLGHHDSLTSLPNRKLFLDRTDQALSLAKRRGNGAAILWIDLDEFKAANDTLGHAAGDALLQQVAQRLKNRIRDSDTLARIGGDEFALVMPEVKNAEAVMQVALELVASLHEPFTLPQGGAKISCSIGIAMYPEHADTVNDLMQCADAAMYRAKHAGKNQVQMGSDQPFELLDRAA
ncbi:diguanylate cyclase domain-containing protein [Rhodoferax sp. PAMC 29310]|uniref:diguanylate cyclase domain-containing protein n=1 Tax=Rhodoferax sp. PAMC 29310 TaxID=2822760 RepID=UPI001B328AA4|nr:diguanylate cyclase [Rhodoferax sp. PAMC 29310]